MRVHGGFLQGQWRSKECFRFQRTSLLSHMMSRAKLHDNAILPSPSSSTNTSTRIEPNSRVKGRVDPTSVSVLVRDQMLRGRQHGPHIYSPHSAHDCRFRRPGAAAADWSSSVEHSCVSVSFPARLESKKMQACEPWATGPAGPRKGGVYREISSKVLCSGMLIREIWENLFLKVTRIICTIKQGLNL